MERLVLVLIKVSLTSLGCAKNQVDSELMLGYLQSHGYQFSDDNSVADVLIINTCGFIKEAKEESIETILRLSKLKEEGNCKILVVCGCLSQRYQEKIKKEIPEIDILLGTDQWDKIGMLLDSFFGGKSVRDDFSRKVNLYSHDDPRLISDLSGHKGSAYIKIAEGCDNHCSYCVIPSIRGEFRSRSICSIKKEAEELVERGVREINLIAQDTTRFGFDIYGEYKLDTLLGELTKIGDLNWIRFMYGHPSRVDDNLIKIIARESKICPYLDLPIQHVSDRILQRMNRDGNKRQIKELIYKLREMIPNLALRTSFMVGFPGETKEEFNELLDFMEEIKFDHAGIFKYSKEEDTKAADFGEDIEEDIVDERYKISTELQQSIMQEKRTNWIGEEFIVLVDSALEEEPGTYLARTKYQAPEVDGSVIIPDTDLEVGTFVRVKITQIIENDLIGEIKHEPGE